MSFALDTNTRSIVEDAAYQHDGDITEYSGRGMYGKTCLGIVMEDYRTIAKFLVYIAAENQDLAEAMASHLRLDNMGRQEIAYWEYIAFDGFTESDDDN